MHDLLDNDSSDHSYLLMFFLFLLQNDSTDYCGYAHQLPVLLHLTDIFESLSEKLLIDSTQRKHVTKMWSQLRDSTREMVIIVTFTLELLLKDPVHMLSPTVTEGGVQQGRV